MWHMGDGWGWWMVVGWVGMIGIVAVVVWAVSALSRGDRRGPAERARPADETALEILERRYAGGELSDEQFERMRHQLRQSSGTS